MHKSSYKKMQYFKKTYLNPNQELKILDIGSYDKNGNFNYGMILKEDKWTYQGLDLKEGNNIDIVVDNPYEWKEVASESYDVVVTGQAFEHIEFFWITLEEIKRILKPDGLFINIVPSSGPVHKNPYDCYRFNENAMKSMAKYIDFEVLETGTNNDEISDPWYDSYLVAKKSKIGYSEKTDYTLDELEEKIDGLEDKLDAIIKKLDIS